MVGSREILEIISTSIENWHRQSKARNENYVIVTDDIRKVHQRGCHRDDLTVVIQELVMTNTEIWHEEDKVRSEHDEVVLKAIRNINPLNQHRNDLIEEIDEIVIDRFGSK